MDNVFGWQVVGIGDSRLTDTNRRKGGALKVKSLASRSVNGKIDTALSDHFAIGRIDNGINLHFGYILSDNLKRHTLSLL